VTILDFIFWVPFDFHTANSEFNVCFRIHENALAEDPIFSWSHHGVLAWAVHASHSSRSGWPIRLSPTSLRVSPELPNFASLFYVTQRSLAMRGGAWGVSSTTDFSADGVAGT
jgi:hypothetical protein